MVMMVVGIGSGIMCGWIHIRMMMVVVVVVGAGDRVDEYGY